jgi:hypothetical protein
MLLGGLLDKLEGGLWASDDVALALIRTQLESALADVARERATGPLNNAKERAEGLAEVAKVKEDL